MKKLFIITIFFFQTGHYFDIQAQQINIHIYNIEDGLVNNDILNIYEDSRGFIWLCTRGGLSRYDGSRFTNYTTENGLTHDMINDIIEIAPQEFIVAQNSDGPRLLKNNRIESLIPVSKITLNKFYKVNNTRLLSVTDHNGIVEWDKGNFRPLNPRYKGSINLMTPLNDSIWLLLNLPNFIQLTTSSLKEWSPATVTTAIATFTDSRHRTWVGTANGLRLLNPEIKKGDSIAFLPLPAAFDLPVLRQAYISDIMEDSQGNYWIGTINGLIKIEPGGKSAIYTQQDGLPASFITCIKEDRQKNLWIGTTMGLAKMPIYDQITTFTPNLGLAYDGSIAASPVTATVLKLFNGKNTWQLDIATGDLSGTTSINTSGYSLFKVNKEQLLIINEGKATVYHAGKKDAEVVNWPDKAFNSIMRTESNIFLAASANKIYTVVNGHSTEKLSTAAYGPVFRMVAVKNKTLWGATWENGLLKINIRNVNDSLQLHIADTFVHRLPDKHIRAVYADRENEVWIGTRYKGIIRLRELPDGKHEIQQYGTVQGLSSDFVLSINRDAKGNIWVGTMQGLDKLIPSENGYRVFNFGKLNKFFSRVRDIILLDDNSMLTVENPYLTLMRDTQRDTLPALPVYITKISGSIADSSFTLYAGNLRLPYNKANIYFEFSAPQFINEDFTKYSYRLSGSGDTAWRISGKSHSVYFASLRPGHYRFEVRALGFNGEWGMPAVYDFIVNTPFWQKAWFIGLMITLVGLLLYALYRYRIQQLVRLQKVRNRIATDLHDEIGSNLTNISILSSLGKKKLSEPEKVNDFLKRISEEVADSSQALDDIIWSVNASHDTLEETVARMRRYAAELFDAANIRYELYLDAAFEEKKLDMEQRRDIYLLYKEAVNNISKHAQATQVSIQIAIQLNELWLTIKDDGKGFEPNKETGRHGIKGMKERIQKWKGEVVIKSAANQGTSIQIRLPV